MGEGPQPARDQRQVGWRVPRVGGGARGGAAALGGRAAPRHHAPHDAAWPSEGGARTRRYPKPAPLRALLLAPPSACSERAAASALLADGAAASALL
eukprot:1940493-Prymnesium_polylepis.1